MNDLQDNIAFEKEPSKGQPPGLRLNVKKVFFLVIMLLSLLAFVGLTLTREYIKPYSQIPRHVTVEIPRGSSTRAIGNLLVQKHLIKSSTFFQIYTRLLDLDQELKAGQYNLDASWSLEKIVKTLTKGQVVTITFMIPEGFTVKQIAKRLEEAGLINQQEFLRRAADGKFDYDFLQGLPPGENHLEGFLFPDTYKVGEEVSVDEIIHLMLKRFDKIYDQRYRERQEELGLSTVEVVTLASIIEREAKLDEERTIISGVFHNRIKKNWRLESCATVQYILDEPKETLLYEDLEIESPYNTYQNTGLPPGPIASPGKASLEAALYPEEVDYFYFVARDDGSHVFSETLAEHNRAKRQYAD